MHEDSVGEALAAVMGVDRVIARPNGMTKLLECMDNVLGLGHQQSSAVGLLGLPLESPIEGTHATQSSCPLLVARRV
jgi:hypothetical protein